jgi:UDP-N-acetylglucosamine acyltransferase
MAIDSTAEIHPTAVIAPGATIGAGCRIGPFCVIGAEVVLGARVTLASHVAVAGITRIGDDTEIYPFASIGHAPQDLKYAGERSELIVGARNRIREYVTMNPGTTGGGGVTRVGDDCLFMMSTHIAHDCKVGNRVIMANCATLAGHVVVEDNVVIGGLSGIHQFARLGRGAMIGGMTGVAADVIPFGSVIGNRGWLAGLNLVGLKRSDASREHIHGLRAAFDELFKGEGTLRERALAVADGYPGNPLVADVVRFITAESSRSFTLPQD